MQAVGPGHEDRQKAFDDPTLGIAIDLYQWGHTTNYIGNTECEGDNQTVLVEHRAPSGISVARTRDKALVIDAIATDKDSPSRDNCFVGKEYNSSESLCVMIVSGWLQEPMRIKYCTAL